MYYLAEIVFPFKLKHGSVLGSHSEWHREMAYLFVALLFPDETARFISKKYFFCLTACHVNGILEMKFEPCPSLLMIHHHWT